MRNGSLVLVLSFVVGCDLLPTASEGDSADTGATEEGGGGGGGNHGGDDPGGGGGGNDDTTTTEPVGGWTESAHPCFGNRTDALWSDDQDTFWVGCGTTTNGYGLYVTHDGGATWESPSTNPAYFLDGMRIDSIQRSADGLLYVAGIAGGYQVLSVDTSSAPFAIEEVFTASGQVWDTWQVGDFLRNSEGLAVAESLNGYGLAYRFADDAPFQDGSYWNPGSYQILDMVLYEDEFYGVGSTISQPPMVFLPPQGGQSESAGFQLEAIQLVDGLGAFGGEQYGIAIDDHGIAVAGVNQSADSGTIFLSGADPYDADQWTLFDVRSLVSDEPTWMRGVCRHGDTIIAVGEYSTREDGLILRSDDNGATFAIVTPPGIPSVQKCVMFDDGTIVVAGMDGWFGTYRP